MFVHDAETDVMRCDVFDVSDQNMIDKACDLLDAKKRVQVLSIIKENPDVAAKITFFGSLKDQIGKGVILHGYQPISGNSIVNIM